MNHFVFKVIIISSLLLDFIAESYATEYTIQNITNSSGNEEHVSIASNGDLVWNLDGDIYYWNGTSPTKIASTNYASGEPGVNKNGELVWYDSARDIYFYDGTPEKISVRTPNFRPKINDSGEATWYGFGAAGGYQIHYYDGTTHELTSPFSTNNIHPSINNSGQIVWYGYNGTRTQIYLWDGTQVSVLPGISDLNCYFPDINDLGQVAFSVYDSTRADYDIYFWNGTEVIRITDDDIDQQYVRINNSGEIVWGGSDNRIYHWDGESINQLTTYDSWRPEISDSNQIVWYGNESGNSDIYLATYELPVTTAVPEPTTLLLSLFGVTAIFFKKNKEK